MTKIIRKEKIIGLRIKLIGRILKTTEGKF